MDGSRFARRAARWLAALLASVIMLPAIAGSGADVAVIELDGTTNHGASGGLRGYSFGTTACNVGTVAVNWCDAPAGCGLGTTDEDHPVIAQNMYRLKSGRLEQIGASWLKHGFASGNTSEPGCGTCIAPPLGADQLGIGCTDAYGPVTNGIRPMSRRSEVDAASGAFPYPPVGGGGTSQPWQQRLAVAEGDLDAALHPGARYFLEGRFVAADDATSGNGLNNAAHREVAVAAGTFDLAFLASTTREKAVIEGWPTWDPAVELLVLDVPGSVPVQRFHVARKVTEPVPGSWHYEYAVHNVNAERAAGRLSIRFLGATTIADIGFHDVDAHSGEVYDIADWPGSSGVDSVAWLVPAFAPAAHANAIRWGTMYNFWFDASRPPTEILGHSLGLFTPGSPVELSFWTAPGLIVFADGFED